MIDGDTHSYWFLTSRHPPTQQKDTNQAQAKVIFSQPNYIFVISLKVTMWFYLHNKPLCGIFRILNLTKSDLWQWHQSICTEYISDTYHILKVNYFMSWPTFSIHLSVICQKSFRNHQIMTKSNILENRFFYQVMWCTHFWHFMPNV